MKKSWIVMVGIVICWWIAIIWVAIHFIHKYW